MEERKCVRCGHLLPEGSAYCPNCGAAPDGTAYDARADEKPVIRRSYGKRPDTLGRYPDIMLIYGVLTTVLGVLLIASSMTVDGMWDSVADADGTYMEMTLSEFKTAAIILGAVFAVSGVLAVIASRMAKNRDRFKVCVALCTVSSVVLLAMGIVELPALALAAVLCIIGLLITHRVYVNADSFES